MKKKLYLCNKLNNNESIIEEKANEIMKYGIYAKDALHISCAIEATCDYFITTDDRILKKYRTNEINVCSPIEFINIWAKWTKVRLK